MKLEELNPKEVFYYFSEIAKIPHGSENTAQLEKYCLDFAAEHRLRSFQDDYGNVMLFKDGTPGYEDSVPVILQGHLDMVCEKRPDCTLDMETEPIHPVTDGEYIWADGTTLGGDDGIAIAYILALLASDEIPHPPIEALLTRNEEIGLRGARMLDPSQLKAKRLINIDSEKEGILTVSCAGAVRIFCDIPISVCEAKGCAALIQIGGLIGGHSGVDINKNRRNAAKTLGLLLDALNETANIRIASVTSGGRLNVIPQTAEAVICFDAKDREQLAEMVQRFSQRLKKECLSIELEAFASMEDAALPDSCSDAAGTENLIFTLIQAPDGVYAMNPNIPGLVQTSLNLGSVRLEKGVLNIGLMVRSNTNSGKQMLIRKITLLSRHLNGSIRLEDDYPAWEYTPQSILLDKMIQAYQDIYNSPPEVCSIHAGLECGILSEKLPGTDMVSFGPDLENVHTPDERMGVKSAERCWIYLLRVLELLK